MTFTLPVTVQVTQPTPADDDDDDDDDGDEGGDEGGGDGDTDVAEAGLASQSAAVELFDTAKTARELPAVDFTVTLPDKTQTSSIKGNFSSSIDGFTGTYETKASGEYAVTANIYVLSSYNVAFSGNTDANKNAKITVEVKNAGKISHCLWENGYVYWDYTPNDSSASMSADKFHIKIASKTVTPAISTANDDFYVEFRSKSGTSMTKTIQLTYVPSGSTGSAAPISSAAARAPPPSPSPSERSSELLFPPNPATRTPTRSPSA